jgi:hypothetical protein
MFVFSEFPPGCSVGTDGVGPKAGSHRPGLPCGGRVGCHAAGEAFLDLCGELVQGWMLDVSGDLDRQEELTGIVRSAELFRQQ